MSEKSLLILLFKAFTASFVILTSLITQASPWWEKPNGVALIIGLPVQEVGSGSNLGYVSAFHGNGSGNHLGITYGMNPLRFDLYQVNGLDTPILVAQTNTTSPVTIGLRGVAISDEVGQSMALAYRSEYSVYAVSIDGSNPYIVSRTNPIQIDAGAFSKDGNYLFSNRQDSSNTKIVKWPVSKDSTTGNISIGDVVGELDVGGRVRNIAYANINGRDLVFAIVDSVGISVADMTGTDISQWNSYSLVTGLPSASYGSLCLSGLLAEGETPTLTVATSINANNSSDVLNVYSITVPSSGTPSASLIKSFSQYDMSVMGCGDIRDANRYGNTIYVTDDNKTLYFARPNGILYGVQTLTSDLGTIRYDRPMYTAEATDYKIEGAVKEAVAESVDTVISSIPDYGPTWIDKTSKSGLASDSKYVGIHGVRSFTSGFNTEAANNSFAAGNQSKAYAGSSIALGYYSEARNGDNYAFVWNGDATNNNYKSKSPGTFNINPIGGLSGFFIGDSPLSDLIGEYVDFTTNNSSLVSSISEIALTRGESYSNIIDALRLSSSTYSSWSRFTNATGYYYYVQSVPEYDIVAYQTNTMFTRSQDGFFPADDFNGVPYMIGRDKYTAYAIYGFSVGNELLNMSQDSSGFILYTTEEENYSICHFDRSDTLEIGEDGKIKLTLEFITTNDFLGECHHGITFTGQDLPVFESVLTNYPTREQIEKGWWSEWETSDSRITLKLDGNYQWRLYFGDILIDDSVAKGDTNSTHLVWIGVLDYPFSSDFTATRHRVAAPIPANTSDLLNDGDGTNAFVTARSIPPVVSNTVTKAYVESLGIEAGISAETATNIANSATNFLTRAEAMSGYTDWLCDPPTNSYGEAITVSYTNFEGTTAWYITKNGEQFSSGLIYDPDATYLQWDGDWGDGGTPDLFTATRHRVTPTKLSQLTNDVGFATATITNGLATPEQVSSVSQAVTNMTELSPVYSQTPTYADEWTFNLQGDFAVIGGYDDSLSKWVYWLDVDGMPYGVEHYFDAPQTTIDFSSDYSGLIAEKKRTDIIGYTLGEQTNKVLAATSITNNLVSTQQMDSLDTSYRHFSEPTNVNQSVQFVTNAPDNVLTIQMPTGNDATKDWIVYAFFATNVTISIPTNFIWFSSKDTVTNEIPANTMTALYFTQIAGNAYIVSRATMNQLVPAVINNTYGRPIESGANIEYAPSLIAPNLREPTENEYNSNGFYHVNIEPPNPPEGQGVATTTYVITNNSVEAVYTYEPTNAVQTTKSFLLDLRQDIVVPEYTFNRNPINRFRNKIGIGF